MNLNTIVPKTPGEVADWSDTSQLQQRMIEAVQEMEKTAPQVGLAHHVREYDADRRKQALSRAMRAALKGGDAVSKAEAEARASEGYAAELAQLSIEHKMAEQTVTEFNVLKLKWETARSLLAMQREAAKI